MSIFKRKGSTSSLHTMEDFIDEDRELDFDDQPDLPEYEPPRSPARRSRSTERDDPSEDECLSFTKKHPLGRVLLDLATKQMALAKKLNFETGGLGELCSQFKNHVITERSVNTATIKTDLEELEDRILKKELAVYRVNQAVQAPTVFSSTPTLTTGSSSRVAELYRQFPIRSGQKFSGNNQQQNIVEFLENICHGQEAMNLSEDEFRVYFRKCFTGKAYEVVRNQLEHGHDFQEIFHTLLSTYDHRMAPHEAELKLFTWKIPKNFNLKRAEAYLRYLAERVASEAPPGHDRTTAYNSKAIAGLLSSLPQYSTLIAYNAKQNHSAKFGILPTFAQLCRSIEKYEKSINDDIKKNGASRYEQESSSPFSKIKKIFSSHNNNISFDDSSDFHNVPLLHTNFNSSRNNYNSRNSRSRNNFKSGRRTGNVSYNRNNFNSGRNNNNSNSSYQTNNTSASNNYNHARNNNINNGRRPNKRNNFQRPNRKVSNTRRPYNNPKFNVRKTTVNNINNANNYKIGSKKYCSLCGATSHNAVDLCYKMKTPKGDNVLVAPSAQPCTICKSKFNEELFHPEAYCWRNKNSSKKQ